MIWVSKYDSILQWQAAQKLPRPINNHGHNSVISFSSDNHHIYLGNTYHNDGSPKGIGLSKTQFDQSLEFTIPSNIHIQGLQQRGQVSSYHVSPNGLYLFLSMDNQSSNSHSDLYISHRIDDTTFSKPIALKKLNTPFDEGTPFLPVIIKHYFFVPMGTLDMVHLIFSILNV